MKSTEFCYWLQGFFEIAGGIPADGLTKAQTEMIQRHLHLVFKHEIDPSYSDKAGLDAIHNPQPLRPPTSPADVSIRC